MTCLPLSSLIRLVNYLTSEDAPTPLYLIVVIQLQGALQGGQTTLQPQLLYLALFHSVGHRSVLPKLFCLNSTQATTILTQRELYFQCFILNREDVRNVVCDRACDVSLTR